MVAGAILPVAIHKNQLLFLFGKEGPMDDTPGWADFGGGCEPGETPYQTALREGSEEISGYLGDENQIEQYIKKDGVYKILNGTYHAHIILIKYDEYLPIYYNQSHTFLWERMDQKYLDETKLFEKSEIAWFTEEEMKKKRNKFRVFYQTILDDILDEIPKIKSFFTKRNSKTRMTKKSVKTRMTKKSVKT